MVVGDFSKGYVKGTAELLEKVHIIMDVDIRTRTQIEVSDFIIVTWSRLANDTQ